MKKVFFIFFVFISFISWSQDTISIAEELIYNEDFSNAIVFYKRLILMDQKNPDFWYKLGFCYLNTEGKADSSIYCFNKSLSLLQKRKKWFKRKFSYQTSPEEVTFYLGRAYRASGRYDSAVIVLNELKKQIKNKRFLKLINKEITKAQTAKQLAEKKYNIRIVNLGSSINSKYTEHTPVFTADESELFFTSRRKLFPDSEPDYDGEYDENIYVSTRDSLGQWSEPVPLNAINTSEHEATICLSYDGTKLFIYKSENNGSIYYSEFKDGQWQKPLKLGKNINTKYRETSASLAVDGNTLYFTSDRPGGYGGLDIYKSEKQPDGTWGPAINLGPEINTSEDEEAPYIHPDNKTLFFSSKGHKTIGGYDIFRSVKSDSGWSQPVNLGIPINSIEDDVFYFPTADGKRAYFASKKLESYGGFDIYLMYIPSAKASEIVVYQAKLTACTENLPQADILVTDLTKGQAYPVTPKNDKLLFIGQRGHKLKILVEVNEKQVFVDTFTVPVDEENIKFYKKIKLDPEIPCFLATEEDDSENLLDSKLVDAYGNVYDKYMELQNILFPLNKAGKVEQNSTLDSLAEYLKNNPEAIIEIIGYADASGHATYNYKLGLLRANSVRNYLIKAGVNPEQLIITSYGEENPIAINKNPDGSWNPQGMKFNRRVEFKVLKQGKQTLLIWQMKIPDNFKNPNYKFNYKKDPDRHKEIDF